MTSHVTKLGLQLQVWPDVFKKQGFHLGNYFFWLLITWLHCSSIQAQACLINQMSLSSSQVQRWVCNIECWTACLSMTTVSGLVLGKNLVGADTSVASHHMFYYNCILWIVLHIQQRHELRWAKASSACIVRDTEVCKGIAIIHRHLVTIYGDWMVAVW